MAPAAPDLSDRSDPDDPGDHDALVLEGGGFRCLFTLGFLAAAGPGLRGVRQIVAVSAAALVAAAHLLGEHQRLVEHLTALLLRRSRRWPWSPALYPRFLAEYLDEERCQRLRAHPVSLRVLWGRGPGRSRLGTLMLGWWTIARGRPPARLQRQVAAVRDLPGRGALLSVLGATAAFLPFTPMPVLDGAAALDGSVVEPVPLSGLRGAARPLVILNEPRPPRSLGLALPQVAPREPLPVRPFRVPAPLALQQAYELGRRRGARFLAAAAGLC